jgi:hypothetical protein
MYGISKTCSIDPAIKSSKIFDVTKSECWKADLWLSKRADEGGSPLIQRKSNPFAIQDRTIVDFVNVFQNANFSRRRNRMYGSAGVAEGAGEAKEFSPLLTFLSKFFSSAWRLRDASILLEVLSNFPCDGLFSETTTTGLPEVDGIFVDILALIELFGIVAFLKGTAALSEGGLVFLMFCR